MSSATMAATSPVVIESAGNTSILSRFGDAGWTPPQSEKTHNPTNSRRALGEHSAICSEVKNSGLIERMRATSRDLFVGGTDVLR